MNIRVTPPVLQASVISVIANEGLQGWVTPVTGGYGRMIICP